MSFPDHTPFALLVGDAVPAKTADDVSGVLDGWPDGVSWCLRPIGADDKRGGYFFHVRQAAEPELVDLHDFEGRHLRTLSRETVARLINHCTGVIFDQEVFDLFQTDLNFREDD